MWAEPVCLEDFLWLGGLGRFEVSSLRSVIPVMWDAVESVLFLGGYVACWAGLVGRLVGAAVVSLFRADGGA